MDCDEVKHLIISYLNNEVSDEERYAMAAHLEECTSCMKQLELSTNIQAEFSAVLEKAAAEASPPLHSWALIKQRLTKNRSYRIPIINSIKSYLTGWWRGLRARPAWQQAFIIVPTVAVLAGSGAAIGYSIITSDIAGQDYNIYVMDSDGSNQIRLTTSKYDDLQPEFSPDGNKIVFCSGPWEVASYNRDIYIMDADGSNLTRLTNNDYEDRMPRFSPDGSKIAFVSYRNPPDDPDIGLKDNGDIYVMDIDGSNVTRVTETVNAREDFFAWSPDGTKIVFLYKRYPNAVNDSAQIYVVNVDGTSGVKISGSYRIAISRLSWLADSTGVLFVAPDEDNQSMYYKKLCLANADGTGVDIITPADLTGHFTLPKASPDGTKIAFLYGPGTSAPDHPLDYAIYTMNIDSSNLTQLTEADYHKTDLHWSPDSNKIAYIAEPEYELHIFNGYEIYVINADGTENTRLTQNNVADGCFWWPSGPVWSPDGSKLVFSRAARRWEQNFSI
ncbi:zf-HC2 domain-containing protein [Chloroflexota bacterium]